MLYTLTSLKLKNGEKDNSRLIPLNVERKSITHKENQQTYIEFKIAALILNHSQYNIFISLNL